MDAAVFRKNLTKSLVAALNTCSSVRAVWEVGSAATGHTDQFSDLDLNILAADGEDVVFAKVETCLLKWAPISHTWNEPKSIWPDLTQKVYILENSPKHFFVDVALFPASAESILNEFMQLERHGKPVVHFDKTGLIKPRPTDLDVLKARHRERLAQIKAAFPIYITEVYKEIDRGHEIDAIGFYHGAVVRPLVELLGMLYRPYQFDFGLRYIKRSFPEQVATKIQDLLFVIDLEALLQKAKEAEQLFQETVARLEAKGI